jgi:hypothetical protein
MSAKLKKIHDDLYEFGSKVKIERGAALLTLVASPETLDDSVTAPKYHAPQNVKMPDGSVETIHARDSLGEPIELGKPMTVRDWNKPSDQRPWFVYVQQTEGQRLVPAEFDERGYAKKTKKGEIALVPDPNFYVEYGPFPTFDEALAEAEGRSQ